MGLHAPSIIYGEGSGAKRFEGMFLDLERGKEVQNLDTGVRSNRAIRHAIRIDNKRKPRPQTLTNQYVVSDDESDDESDDDPLGLLSWGQDQNTSNSPFTFHVNPNIPNVIFNIGEGQPVVSQKKRMR